MGRKDLGEKRFKQRYQHGHGKPGSDGMIKAYEKSKKQNGKISDVYANLGFACLTNENYAEALTYFQKVIDLEPHNQEALQILGYIYERMNRLGSAKQRYEQALKLDPGNIELIINIANIPNLNLICISFSFSSNY